VGGSRDVRQVRPSGGPSHGERCDKIAVVRPNWLGPIVALLSLDIGTPRCSGSPTFFNSRSQSSGGMSAYVISRLSASEYSRATPCMSLNCPEGSHVVHDVVVLGQWPGGRTGPPPQRRSEPSRAPPRSAGIGIRIRNRWFSRSPPSPPMSRQSPLPVNSKNSSRNSKHRKAVGNEVFDTSPLLDFSIGWWRRDCRRH
jgi:hypothetical protein